MKTQKTTLTPWIGALLGRRTLQVFLFSALGLAALMPKALAQNTFILSNAVTLVATGTGNLTGSSTTCRGMAYNAASNQVLVANASSGSIDAFDGTSGALIGALSTSGASGGTFLFDQVGVGGDGLIYAINLSTASSSANKIYQWTAWNASAPTISFNGNALGNGGPITYTSGRIGDTFAVTGSGTNTLLLAGVGGSTNFVLFYTANGTSFSPVIVDVSSGYTAGGNVYGICFFTNNTFLVKSASSGGSTAYLIQFPTNYASQTVVTGTVLGTATLGSSFTATTLLSYDPVDGLLAAANTGNGSTTPVGLFAFTSLTAGAGLLSVSNASTSYAGGNATGGVAIFGTNAIYEMTTGNALYKYPLASVPAQPPTVSTAPVAGNYYLSDTLTVAAAGTPPYTYQWFSSTNNSTNATSFSNILGATGTSYTISTITTNYYEVVISNIAGSVTSAPVQVAILPAVTSVAVTNVWRVAAGASGYSYLTTDDACRGLAYDTNLQRLVVVNKTGPTANILSALNGTNAGTLSMTGVSGGTFALDQVAIGDDGAVYGGNLVTSGTGFTLYRWPAATNTAVAAKVFQDSGVLGGVDRWGDTMAIRGGGVNTQILLGSRSGTNVALLTTSDGTNFSGTFIQVSGAAQGFAANGITFGTGNTLWAKSYLGDLYEISFDTNALVGSVLLDYPNPSKIPSSQVGIGVDTNLNIMAGIVLGDSPNDVRLYQLTGTADAPVLFDQSFFASANANGNANGVVVMKYPWLFALDVNNGLVALTYNSPPETGPSVNSPPASQSVYTNDPAVSMQAGVSGSLPLYYQWQYSASSNGPFANINLATNGVYTINYPTPGQAGYYQVVVHNVAGSATSTPPALLTVLIPASNPAVSNLWSIPGGVGGSLSFLDSSSYQTRGLAYDTNTQQLVVADHMNLHLLGTNGSYIGDLGSAAVPVNGLNGWLYGQVGVATDGTLYAGNITLTGPGYSITAWAPGISTGANPVSYSYGGSSGADPGNGSGDRWGDTMDVRGSGTGTEILIGSYTGTNVVLFTTTDGSSFTANLIPVTNVPAGFSGQGIAFGAGDTFWVKSPGYNLRQVAFDRTSWTGSEVQTFVAGTQFPSAFDGIGVDTNANVLAGVNFSDVPNDVQVYSLSGNTNAPALIAQEFFASVNMNSQLNAATTLKGGLGFSLDVNNGIVAFSYGALPGGAVTITSVAYAPGNVTVNFNNTFNGHSYQLQSATTLAGGGNWANVGAAVVASGPTASAADTSASATAKYYRVVNN